MEIHPSPDQIFNWTLRTEAETPRRRLSEEAEAATIGRLAWTSAAAAIKLTPPLSDADGCASLSGPVFKVRLKSGAKSPPSVEAAASGTLLLRCRSLVPRVGPTGEESGPGGPKEAPS